MKKARRNFFSQSIDENKGNPKGIWRLLKQLGGTSKPLPKISNLNYNGSSVAEPEMIAESLNNFFVESIASSNEDNVEECNYSKLRNFISSRSESGASYSIPLISKLEVSNIFKSLASNKASGHDSLSPRILKVCSPHLFNPLYKLINLSIAYSVFPSSWKIADVIPIHKSGPCDDPNNYRPVLILPFLSNVMLQSLSLHFYKKTT